MTRELTQAVMESSLSSDPSNSRTLKTAGETDESERIAMVATEGVASVAGYMTGYLPTFVEVLLLIPLSLLILIPLNGWAGLTVGLGMLALPMVAMVSRKRDITVQTRQLSLYENVGSDFSDALLGMPDLKTFGADGRVARTLRGKSEGFRVATMDVLRGQLSALIGADTVIAVSVSLATLLAALTGGALAGSTPTPNSELAWVFPRS